RESLSRLLRGSPALQQVYLDHLQLHALLLWRTGNVTPGTKSLGEPSSVARSGRAIPRWIIAASVAAAVPLTFLSVAFRRQPSRQDPIPELVDWTVDLSETPLPDRRVSYEAKVGGLQKSVNEARLSDDDRVLANSLLATGEWL